MIDVPARDVREGGLYEFEVDDRPVLVTRVDGHPYAIGGRCRHLGCHLARGKLDGQVVTCPCHGSRYDVTTGKLVEAVSKWPKAIRGAVALAVGDEPIYKVEAIGDRLRLST